MEDRKLNAIKDHFDALLGEDNTYMWFLLPGGMIIGKPITAQEYYGNREIEDMSPGEQTRFFHLKEARLAAGPQSEKIGLTIIDGLAVSAWGFAERQTV